jgi:large repetitive protein
LEQHRPRRQARGPVARHPRRHLRSGRPRLGHRVTDFGVSAGNWSSRHTGEIGLNSGSYGFSLAAVDGARLWIDDLLVVDNWVASPLTETGSITVAEGRHRIRIDHFASSSTSGLSLRWTPPSSSPAVVPGTALFPSYGLVTKTTDPDGKVSKTEYQDPALAAPTAQVADPAGLNLRTETSYEAAGIGKYFRRLTRTLPKGAQTPAVADDYQTSYSYWDNGQMQPNPCTGG